MGRFSFLVVCTLFSCVAVGCARNGYDPQGALSVPPDGSVRVLSRKIEQTPNRLHWKWSLIGERNWIEPAATETRVSLDKTYPKNSVKRHDGTNIWEVDFVAERANGTLRWTNRVHGINGATREAKGTMSLPPGASDNAAQIELDRDALERLPADVVLARVGDKTVTLRLAQ